VALSLLYAELEEDHCERMAFENALPEVLPELPDWMVELDRRTPPMEPPTCGCCGRPEHLYDEAEPSAPSAQVEEGFWATPGVTGLDDAPAPVQPIVGELMQQLVALGEQIAAVDPSALDPGQALGEAAALTGLQHTIRTAQLSRTKDISDRRLFEHLGYRSPAAWQRDTAPDTPRSERTLSRRLGALPHLRGALYERQVSFGAANQVGKALAELNPHLDQSDGLIDGLPGDQVIAEVCSGALDLIAEHHFGLSADKPEQAALLTRLDERLGQIALSPTSQLDRVEQLLVLLATELPADKLSGVLEHVRLQLLPSVLELQERDAQHSRDLKLKPNSNGTWDLRATLTSEVGEQLFTALASEARRDPANPTDTHAREAAADAAQAAAEAAANGEAFDEVQSGLLHETNPWEARPLGSDADEPIRPRSRGQRLQDALGRLLTRYLTEGMGGVSSKIPVQITAVVNERTLRGAPGAPPARGGTGRPLARSLIQRLWCDARVTPLLMSDGWIPLAVQHSQRTTTAVENKALRVQFGNRCPGIGCCTGQPDPLTPLVPHHVDMFSTTGITSISTTLPCCENLHRDIHLGQLVGKIIRLRDGSFISEDGYLHTAD
jgi:hypothetical protein